MRTAAAPARCEGRESADEGHWRLRGAGQGRDHPWQQCAGRGPTFSQGNQRYYTGHTRQQALPQSYASLAFSPAAPRTLPHTHAGQTGQTRSAVHAACVRRAWRGRPWPGLGGQLRGVRGVAKQEPRTHAPAQRGAALFNVL